MPTLEEQRAHCEAVLTSDYATREERQQAAMSLVHIIADIDERDALYEEKEQHRVDSSYTVSALQSSEDSRRQFLEPVMEAFDDQPLSLLQMLDLYENRIKALEYDVAEIRSMQWKLRR